jgi:hypothetical protein
MRSTRKAIQELVETELERVANDRELTVRTVSAHIESDARLLQQLLKEIVWEAIYAHGRYALTRQRRAIVGRSATMKKRIGALLEFPLLSGKPLGESTKSEVLDHAAFCDRLAIANAERARFLFNVAERLPSPRAKVKNYLTADELERLYTEAKLPVEVAA